MPHYYLYQHLLDTLQPICYTIQSPLTHGDVSEGGPNPVYTSRRGKTGKGCSVKVALYRADSGALGHILVTQIAMGVGGKHQSVSAISRSQKRLALTSPCCLV